MKIYIWSAVSYNPILVTVVGVVSLVLKNLQSNVILEALEELMHRVEESSDMSWIIEYDQVSRTDVYWQISSGTVEKKTNTCNPYKVSQSRASDSWDPSVFWDVCSHTCKAECMWAVQQSG